MNVPRRHVSGLSLIELMVAMLIGTLLILGLVQIFSASRTAYQLSEGLARTQENSRFALDYLQRDIRMAGHFGCVNDQARAQIPGAFTSHLAIGGAVDYNVSIQGYTGSVDANAAGLALGAAPLAGSDILVLRYLVGNGVPITLVAPDGGVGPGGTVSVDPAKWDLLTQDGVAAPQTFGLADCSYADVFQAASVNSTTGVVTVPDTVDLARYTASPAGQAVLYRADTVVYYIANGAGGGPSLFRKRYTAAGASITEELVEGIENMQLRYGQDQATAATALPTGNINLFANSAGVINWQRVGLVQVGLLARSPDRAAALQPGKPPSVLGTPLAVANDGRFRAVYESMIALRNRLYGQ